jgi:hypothetical protein
MDGRLAMPAGKGHHKRFCLRRRLIYGRFATYGGKAGMSSGKDVTMRDMAYFARANYSYNDKYIAQLSIRREGSSKFAAANRWASFPAASAAWHLSNEGFIKDNLSWVNDLKLRASWGKTGEQDFDGTYMADLLGSDVNWMLPDGTWAMSYGPTSNINPNLGWEKTSEWDFGLDYSFLNNRLYGKFDYFTAKVSGLLFSVKVSQPPYPNNNQWQNIGDMSRHGWEFEIGGIPVKAGDFTWTTQFNFSHDEEKLDNLYGNGSYIEGDDNNNGFPSPGNPGDAHRLEAGTKYGSFYIWKFAGFDKDGNWLLYNKDGKVIPASEKTDADRRYIGNYNPKVRIYWNNTLTYKHWDMGLNFRSYLGFDIYNTLPMYFGIQGMGNTNLLKEAFTKYANIKGEKELCDYYLENGNFLKLDAVSLGYTLPIRKYTKWVDSIRLYATVGNVFSINGCGSGVDPDQVNLTGWENGFVKFWENNSFYPITRTYTFGLNLNF